MNAKQTILKKLQMAAPPFPGSKPLTSHLAVSPLADRAEDLKKVFIREAEGLACQVYDLQNAEALPEILVSVLNAERIISAWDLDRIPVFGFRETLNQMGIQIANPTDPSVMVGITGADAALAATGSVVLNRRSGQPTGPSLLPPIHVAIITEDQVLPNFEAWAAKQRSNDLEGFERSGNIVIVSGPSRTADIAMELILGMHGPKEQHIIILPEEKSQKL